MTITKHNDSHLDHSLTDAQVAFILDLPAKEGELCIQTVELPAELGEVPCALYGPLMGDEPVPDAEVRLEARGGREGSSRLVERPVRPCRKVTVISGPHDGLPCVLFTAFGGPQAPKEPFEFGVNDLSPDACSSREFWSKHALAAD